MDRNVRRGKYEQQYLDEEGEQADPALRQFFADVDAIHARPLPPGLQIVPDWFQRDPAPVVKFPGSQIWDWLQIQWLVRWWGRPAGRWQQIRYWLHLQWLLRGWA